MIGGREKWSTPFTADTWFNFAYDINVRQWPNHTPQSPIPTDEYSGSSLLGPLVFGPPQTEPSRKGLPKRSSIHLHELCRFPRWCPAHHQQEPSRGLVLERCLY